MGTRPHHAMLCACGMVCPWFGDSTSVLAGRGHRQVGAAKRCVTRPGDEPLPRVSHADDVPRHAL